MNKYLEYIKDKYDALVISSLQSIIENGWVDELQCKLNQDFNASLTEDGIFGLKTLNQITKVLEKNKEYIHNFVKRMQRMEDENFQRLTEDEIIERLKDPLMNFLADVEGTIYHFNKGEKTYTTPYGVYKYLFPNEPIIKYSDGLYKKYNLDVNSRQHAYALNKRLKMNEKIKIKDLAWDFYLRNFLNMKVIHLLNLKTSMTYLSISINGGKNRGNKAIQSAIGVTVDGVIGAKTISALKEYIDRLGYPELNCGMLKYMERFYDILVRRNPSKYGRFRNGWQARLKKTDFWNCLK